MEPFLGEIRLFSFGKIPRGWAPCNGQLLPVQPNQALFSIFGYTYGGNGTSTFALPNLQGSVPLGFGLAYPIGQTGGEATHTLVPAELPQHSHPVACLSTAGNASVATGNYPAGSKLDPTLPIDTPYSAAANSYMAAGALANAGSGYSHDNMQPFLALNFCVAIVGIYPTRP